MMRFIFCYQERAIAAGVMPLCAVWESIKWRVSTLGGRTSVVLKSTNWKGKSIIWTRFDNDVNVKREMVLLRRVINTQCSHLVPTLWLYRHRFRGHESRYL